MIRTCCTTAFLTIALFCSGVAPGYAVGFDMGPASVMAADQGGMAADTRRGMGNRKWWQNDAFTATMNLSSGQKEALETYANKQRLAMIDLRAAVQRTRLILETSLDTNFKKEASLNYLTDYLAAKNSFEEARMMGLIHTREILTEEQFQLLKKRTREMREMSQGKNRRLSMNNRMDRRTRQ